MMKNNTPIHFLASAISPGVLSTNEIVAWIKAENEAVHAMVSEIPLTEMKGWSYTPEKIAHESGRFFSIEGIKVATNYGLVPEWSQPIINQPEIGFLGMIVKKINGILHFLVQAKIEPGNVNKVQLSPTLQATRSNYTQVHKGKTPLYLEYFNGGKKVEILVDQLQSEQGARFLHKRNRNIIVEVAADEEIPIYANFRWMTLRQIKELMQYPNLVNMDTRTVISCIPYGSYSEDSLQLLSAFNVIKGSDKNSSNIYSLLSHDNHLHDFNELIQWITNLKFKFELSVNSVPLSVIPGWIVDKDFIRHKEGKYFSVIGVNVEIGNREVVSWDQPMVKAAQDGIAAFIIKRINGIYHFLVQAKLEAGNFDVVELAPTVQCLTGNYRKGNNEYTVPYLDIVLNAKPEEIWYSVYQSEEGGRFYHEQNLNMIVEVAEDSDVDEGDNYCWMTLNQLLSFVTFNNYVNISARSILSAIQFHI